ncbi:MAG: KpsF/GutQ family sugar-phosphate isomerase [Nitrospirae bacterium]|nr:KpsF/GutQ family sugar-phosphate isomerase [Nitrospirota bacterium]MBF0541226.1 KpsF/GutQ family sugar-phosphate isomerase [Nitrospirota bacterium]
MDILNEAKNVLEIEAQGILDLRGRLDASFEQAIDLIYNSKGKVVVMGMGKSGHIARKVAATLSSTGTPAFFVHPGEAAHGDLGMVSERDIIIALSNSGETEEILKLIPFIKRFRIKLISLTKPNSTLSRQSDITINTSVDKEACPIGIVPTTSTTATLAMGDTIAVVLLIKRGFKKEDFAVFHPDGSLGKQLLVKVADLMHKDLPIVNENTLMTETVLEMTAKRLGMTIVCDSEGKITGVITDGDLRRGITKWGIEFYKMKAGEVQTANPIFISKETLAATALSVMQEYSITSIIVPDDELKPTGIIHIHDILKKGII